MNVHPLTLNKAGVEEIAKCLDNLSPGLLHFYPCKGCNKKMVISFKVDGEMKCSDCEFRDPTIKCTFNCKCADNGRRNYSCSLRKENGYYDEYLDVVWEEYLTFIDLQEYDRGFGRKLQTIDATISNEMIIFMVYKDDQDGRYTPLVFCVSCGRGVQVNERSVEPNDMHFCLECDKYRCKGPCSGSSEDSGVCGGCVRCDRCDCFLCTECIFNHQSSKPCPNLLGHDWTKNTNCHKCHRIYCLDCIRVVFEKRERICDLCKVSNIKG